MNREEAKTKIKYDLKCTSLLKPGRKSGWTCPFCNSGQKKNGTGAVQYYPETNTCTCFACDQSFDNLDIIQKEYSCDYNKALEIGAKQLNISFDGSQEKGYQAEDFKAYRDRHRKASEATESRPKDEGVQNTTEAVETALNGSAEPAAQGKPEADYTEYYKVCRERLQNSAEAVSYLAARGISLETAERCGVGYDPAADPSNFPGLLDDSVKPWYPVKRIILPSSKCHYVGRRIDGVTGHEKPNNKGSAGHLGIFNQADLYNGHKTVFVVEGAFDAMSIIEAGAAAVGLNSTNNGKTLLDAIKEKAPDARNFVICPDKDEDPKTRAKVEADAEALKGALNGFGYNALIFDICGNAKDANEALCANYKAFKEKVDAAILEAEKPAPDALDDFFQEIQSERYKPYKTGLSWFDDLLGGGLMRQTTLYVLAAPGTGKTALAQQLATAMAKNKKPVVYFSFEMSTEQMLSRDLSRIISKNRKYDFTMTAADVLQGYNWSERQRQAVTLELEKYRAEIFPYLQYNPTEQTDIESITDYLSFIGSKAKAAGEDAPVIIIDYLHLIRSKTKLEVQELLKAATQAFNDYVREYDTAAIVISATNRGSNTSGTISGSSGRDSSNIEYSATIQIGLNYYDIETGKVKAESLEHEALKTQAWRQMILKLTKNRFGTAGRTQRLYFHAAGNAFYADDEWLPVDPERTPFAKENDTKNAPNW